MGSFLTELGKKLAERWVSLLVLPGALYLCVATTARALGHTHAFDLAQLTIRITAWAAHPAVGTIGGQVVLLAAVLAAAAVAGLTAQALGSLTERICLAPDWHDWPTPLRRIARWRTVHRRERWIRTAQIWHQHREDAARLLARGQRIDPAPRQAAHHAMIRVALEEPDRPTWSGDRLNAAAVRLERDQHLALATLWPHLWLILPEETRTEITNARQSLTRATALIAWALLYLPLAACWWPSALIAAALALIGRTRIRAASDTYALLLEAATRLHSRDLADRLGLDSAEPLSPDTGDALTRYLSHSPPPPPGSLLSPGQ